MPKAKSSGKQLRLLGGRYLSIDDSFLSYIGDIRLHLAQAFYQNNPALNSYQLTEATQRTIDRLVFMRFLEDKQIEPETLLYNIASAAHPWAKFITECKRLDTKYNGIVFKPHFIDQNSFLGADETAFRDIASDLDHTNTPYDFNYIPVHILGSIYERFLGNIIAIDNGKAAIEQKPEVRKAGGVFYTPKYIVDYIVENTVGKIIAGKNPDYITKLKFADIACGSGSFLIGVYDCLLDYHKNYYNRYPDKAKSAGCHFDEATGTWVLSIKQKQRILLNNIYGVDIDLQATEVTQLSLFLKLLEDETDMKQAMTGSPDLVQFGSVDAADRNGSRGRRQKKAHRQQCRCLAAAGRPHNQDHLARPHEQIELTDGLDSCGSGAVVVL